MARHELFEEALTRSVIGAFFDVYNTLRFGFLEHIYALALERELLARGHRVAREVGVCIMYKGDELGTQRLDMVVDEKLVVEIKATAELHKAAASASQLSQSKLPRDRAAPAFRPRSQFFSPHLSQLCRVVCLTCDAFPT
jgi:GxxExxY protein